MLLSRALCQAVSAFALEKERQPPQITMVYKVVSEDFSVYGYSHNSCFYGCHRTGECSCQSQCHILSSSDPQFPPAFPRSSLFLSTPPSCSLLSRGAGEPVFSEEVPSGTWAFRKDTLPSISCQGQYQTQMLFNCMWVNGNTVKIRIPLCVLCLHRSTHGVHVCMHRTSSPN